MATVSDLGKKLKAKHPQKFGHLTDADAGRQAKAEYPEHYGHYEDDGLAVTSYQGITPFYTPQPQSTGLIGTDQNIERKIQKLWDKHDSQMGTFVGWWRRHKVEAQNRYLTQANEQQRLLIEQAMMITEAVIKGRKTEQEFQLFLANNHYQIVQLQVWGMLLVEAAKEGLSVAALEEKRLSEHYAQIRNQEEALKQQGEQASYDRKIEADREAQRLASLTYTQKTTTDTDNEVRLAYEKLKFQIIAEHLTQQQVIDFIQDLIDQQFIKIAQTAEDSKIPTSAKQNITESRMRIIQMYMEQQNETQQRILGSRDAKL